jgi:hypothetical protein
MFKMRFDVLWFNVQYAHNIERKSKMGGILILSSGAEWGQVSLQFRVKSSKSFVCGTVLINFTNPVFVIPHQAQCNDFEFDNLSINSNQ